VPRVDTYGLRKTAHVFGAGGLPRPREVTFQFASVFNGKTFFEFLRQLVLRYRGRKVFLIHRQRITAQSDRRDT
jgi:hypothetical protein